MNVNFRQGIVTYPTSGNLQSFLTYSGGYVTLNAANGNTDVVFAFGDTNYLHTESTTVNNAWGPLPAATDCWLYWDLDARTGVRTFGFTTVAPVFGSIRPAAPVLGMHWFDTNAQKMYAYTNAFREVIRVFAAKVNTGVFTPMGSGVSGKPYAGTQVGLTSTDTRAGRILIDYAGNPIRKTGGQFFTSEDDIYINTSLVNVVRLDSTVVPATAMETLAKFTVVKFTEFGKISAAEYNDIGTTTIAMLTEDLVYGATGTVCVQGLITNPNWNWSTVGANLWVLSSGQLTETDPHTANANVFPISHVPIARVVTPTSVIFDQGLGGKGDKGDIGSIAGLGPATTDALGLVALSVAPSDAEFPMVVGDNDPRLNNKVLRTGDTMTGPLILSGDPVASLGAVTKQYVDNLTLNSLSDVNTAGATTDMALIYNGTNWAPGVISTEDNTFVFQLRSVAGQSSHLHYVSVTADQANTLITNTDPTVAVADPSQPSLTLTSSVNANTGNPGHTHVVTVMYDYVNATLVATSISDNTIDVHTAKLVADGVHFDQDLNTFNDVAFASVTTGVVSNNSTIAVNIDTGAPSTWYQVYGDLASDVNDDYPGAVAYDSTGNLYLLTADGSNGLAAHLVKYNPTGQLVWQRSFQDGLTFNAAGTMAVDSDDNVVFALIRDSNILTNYFTVIKVNGAGDTVWSIKVDEYDGVGDGRALDLGMAIATDALNNIYVTGTIAKDVLVIKFSPLGAMLWTRLITSTIGAQNDGDLDDAGVGIAVDTDGYVYVNARSKRADLSAMRLQTLIKLDVSTGATAWQREVSYGVNFNAATLAVDGAGGIYTVGTYEGANATIVAKFDRSGNHVWSRSINTPRTAYSITCDGTNVYVLGHTTWIGLYVIKFSLTGDVVWVRKFLQSTNDYVLYWWTENCIAVYNNVYAFAGHTYIDSEDGTASYSEVVTAQLLTDGSGTGTYGAFTYADGAVDIPISTPTNPTVIDGALTESAFASQIHLSASAMVPTIGANSNTTYVISPASSAWAFNTNGSFTLPGYTLPAVDGAAGQALVTDGSGNATWQSVGGESVQTTQVMTLNSSAPMTFGAGLNTAWNQTGPRDLTQPAYISYDSYFERFTIDTGGFYVAHVVVRATSVTPWPTTAPTALQLVIAAPTAQLVGTTEYIVRRPTASANDANPDTLDLVATFMVSGFPGYEFSLAVQPHISTVGGTDSTNVEMNMGIVFTRVGPPILLS